MGRRSRQAKRKAADSAFRMVVAAQPPAQVSIEPELDLIKAGLLYGDEVTLISPVTTMFLGIEQWGEFSMVEQLRLLRKVAPYLQDENASIVSEHGDKLEAILSGGGLRNRVLSARLGAMFKPTQESTAQYLEGLSVSAGVAQLADARTKGLLKIESVDPGTAADLIASCVIMALCAQEGKPKQSAHFDQILATFIGKLSDRLSSGREYLIFDEKVANLTRAGIREGLFRPAKGPTGRSVQAMVASGLMARLPTFPDATLDEVLDIRSELSPALSPFRAAMVTLSKEFEEPAWGDGFDDELHDAWVESVHPAIQAIDESVRSNKSLLTAASNVMAGALLPGLTILGAGIAAHASGAIDVGAAATATIPLLQALRARRDAVSEIRMQPFYFLYAMNDALS